MCLNIYIVNRPIHDCAFKPDQKRMRYPCFGVIVVFLFCGFSTKLIWTLLLQIKWEEITRIKNQTYPSLDCKATWNNKEYLFRGTGKMKGGVDWNLGVEQDPWKFYLMFLFREIDIKQCQRNWEIATSSNFLISIYLQRLNSNNNRSKPKFSWAPLGYRRFQIGCVFAEYDPFNPPFL